MLAHSEAHVAQYWHEVMDACHIPRNEVRARAFAKLAAAYSEPGRQYHNLDHISQMLDVLLSWEFVAKDWKPLLLAAFFHDVVYDSHSSENERRSADVAEDALRVLDLDDNRIARVRELILYTKDHQAPGADSDALLLLGADLSILGMPKRIYESYRLAIRKEYGWVPEIDFCAGRRRVLQQFLERPKIYQSDYLSFLEDRARANIGAEIAQIDDLLRTLSP